MPAAMPCCRRTTPPVGPPRPSRRYRHPTKPIRRTRSGTTLPTSAIACCRTTSTTSSRYPIRHSVVQAVRDVVGPQGAQAMRGQSRLSTTEVSAKASEAKAIEAARVAPKLSSQRPPSGGMAVSDPVGALVSFEAAWPRWKRTAFRDTPSCLAILQSQ